MRTIVDLINFSSLALLDGNVPKRVWTRKDVSYKHLKVFSCRAYVYIFKDERSKLNEKANDAFS